MFLLEKVVSNLYAYFIGSAWTTPKTCLSKP